MYINNLRALRIWGFGNYFPVSGCREIIPLDVTPLAITYVFHVSFSATKELIKINYLQIKKGLGWLKPFLVLSKL
ncbi:hypothetical protein [Ruminiclostridium cellobioparum]|uniref:Uncharacterized protein n=1 Tax=Ruminiclostridium cellobioparum subsp. termitidis CT1112 TaxID=1195236 RepID=S0FKV3_RUMCE|nr:hypothetical protein [Ruminiclostridium cellobioparum]EMS72820.1 hypothetical protein CTER_1185 [Ruminiclostridium cellobioparum subsp. termitidis CT1112]